MVKKLGKLIKHKLLYTNLKKHIQNIGWMMIGKAVTMATSFVATFYIAKTYGPMNFGQLSYAQSFVGILSFFAPLGLDTVLYRELVKYPEKRNVLMGTSSILRLISSSISLSVIFLACIFSHQNFIQTILILIVSISIILNTFQLIQYELLAKSQNKSISIIGIIIVLIINITKIFIAKFGGNVIHLGLTSILESALYATFYINAYRKSTRESLNKWKWDATVAKNLLKDSAPLIILAAFSIIYTRVDQIIIKQYFDVSKVGIYDAAVRLTDLWNFVPTQIVVVLFPTIINSLKIKYNVYRRRVLLLAVSLFLIATTAAVLTYFLADRLILLIYGNNFIESADILKIYIWSQIWVSIGMLANYHMVITNDKKMMLISPMLAAVVNIILNLLLDPIYGLRGAAFATIISYVFITLPILKLLINKNNKINKIKYENNYPIAS